MPVSPGCSRWWSKSSQSNSYTAALSALKSLKVEMLAERLAQHGPPVGKHGHTRRGKTSPEYMAWANMKDRCLNPNHREFHLWRGRGIIVCDRWLNGEDGLSEAVVTNP
jgi:hypothetical protein